MVLWLIQDLNYYLVNNYFSVIATTFLIFLIFFVSDKSTPLSKGFSTSISSSTTSYSSKSFIHLFLSAIVFRVSKLTLYFYFHTNHNDLFEFPITYLQNPFFHKLFYLFLNNTLYMNCINLSI